MIRQTIKDNDRFWNLKLEVYYLCNSNNYIEEILNSEQNIEFLIES